MAIGVAIGLCGLAAAQRPDGSTPNAVAIVTENTLPDSPGALLASSRSAAKDPVAAPVVPTRDLEDSSVEVPARKYHRVVRPYEQAAPLTGFDKVKLSVASRMTYGEALGTVWSAGWSQWRNSRPHTGTDTGAFEERLRDLAIKQTTQSFFAYGVYAAAFHEDPRYYIMGRTVKPMHRVIYSAERTVITQKDDGSPAINWAKIAGIATSTALTTAYYPDHDRGLRNDSEAFATSLATSVLNDELHEFGGDVLRLIHRHRQGTGQH